MSLRSSEKDRLVAGLQQRYKKDDGHSSPYTEEGLRRIGEFGAARFGMHADRERVEAASRASSSAPPLARMIDHTALKPETSAEDVRGLCNEAMVHCFASVCINPCYVPLAADLLRDTPVKVCTVIGFPLGGTQTDTKAAEAELAVQQGADEVDMVMNIGFFKSEHYEEVERDIRAVVEAAQSPRRGEAKRAVVKVIIETALLTDREKVIACILAQNAGADFVKTSTGFSTSGATPSDVALMNQAVGGELGVKASGGVRSVESARTMIVHGASRIGASASVAIMKGLEAGEDQY